MARRPLIIVHEHPEIQEKWEKYSTTCDTVDSRVESLRQKAVKLLNDKMAVRKAFWDDLVVCLKDKLPLDYSHDKYALSYNGGVLYISSREEEEERMTAESLDQQDAVKQLLEEALGVRVQVAEPPSSVIH